ncbi:tyrosine-type recombinase/integrase [Microvirga guangxiensis]|uniref:Phage integrase family protein n=1 Tax=Microvirga guangxiensis TaxID=549386 RepID=A0A1G5JX35_9HYPH|nr:tyrosine-type recombinase/integrase [Microvirga guangxiensis]SCY92430.1 Phage integrase family protein [Microvirga guangxiensis]
MNHVDPKFLARSKTAFLSEHQTTLADVKRLAEDDQHLTAIQRRDLVSALNRVEQMFESPLDKLEASPRRVRELFASRSAAQVNLSEKTFANIRSLVTKAVARYGQPILPLTKRIAIAPSWQTLLNRIEPAYQRQALYRLTTYCSIMGIPPEEVTTQTLPGLFGALEVEEAIKNPKDVLKNTIVNWNRSARTIPGWPQVILSSPFKQKPYTLALSTFPVSFQADVEAWKQRMADPDPLDEEAPARVLRPATIEHRIDNFRQFASALVHTGRLPVEAITSLSVLFQPEAFKSALRFFLDRSGKKTQRVHNLARSMRLIGKHYGRLDEATLATLEKVSRKLDPGNRCQMTDRNRQRLGQFDDPRNVGRLLTFPEREAKRALTEKNPLRAAKRMERAVAVDLLIHCGLRIGSLRTLEMADFTWLSSGRAVLVVRAERTKTGRPLEFELNPEVTVRLKHHIAAFRSRLPQAEGPFLFPGPSGGPRSQTAMADAIRRGMRQTGLEMNPHLFRHAIAKIAVEADPGAYLAVSRVLGHTTLDTTMGHYLGTESKAAGRHVDRLLDEAKAKASKGKR